MRQITLNYVQEDENRMVIRHDDEYYQQHLPSDSEPRASLVPELPASVSRIQYGLVHLSLTHQLKFSEPERPLPPLESSSIRAAV